MKRIAIFYGSNSGHTAEAATRIAREMGVNGMDVYNVDSARPSDVADYQVLLLGTSTWGKGEMTASWQDFIAGLSAMDLKGTTIALFGTGDCKMADTFCDGVGELYDRLQDTGARFVGEFPTTGLEFNDSKAVRIPGVAVGLLLDDVNHADLTAPRIALWTQELKKNIEE